MTNRSKQGTNTGTRKSLNCLDLSFEGQPTTPSNGLTLTNGNGPRPLTGSRANRKQPPSPHSFNKGVDYQRQLHDDMDDLLESDAASRSSSPAWAVDISKQANHSGESPLFVHKLLSASRTSQHSDPGNYPRAARQSQRRFSAPPTGKDGQMYYRPNRTHQYLTATELKDASVTDGKTLLGRPTRTTLLRARQRCNSAPINAYIHRRELIQQAEHRVEHKRVFSPANSVQDLLDMQIPVGESIHSFLTGARYNRAHYLDAKSLTEHGVYMPRGNPLGCFMVSKSVGRAMEGKGAPTPRPDSPDSQSEVDEESAPVEDPSAKPCGHGLQPQPHSQPDSRTPSVTNHQAWEDDTKLEIDIQGEQAPPPSKPPSAVSKGHQANMPFLQSIVRLEEGLNVAGIGFSGTKTPRPRSSRANGCKNSNLSRAVPGEAFPTVMITGRALSRAPPRPGPFEPTHLHLSDNQPEAPPSSPKNARPSTAIGFSNGFPDNPRRVAVEVEQEAVTTEDKAVNFPSEAGDVDDFEGQEVKVIHNEDAIDIPEDNGSVDLEDGPDEEEEEEEDEEEYRDEEDDTIDVDGGMSSRCTKSTSILKRPKTAKAPSARTRVRFVDQEALDGAANETFFITEDDQENDSQGQGQVDQVQEGHSPDTTGASQMLEEEELGEPSVETTKDCAPDSSTDLRTGVNGGTDAKHVDHITPHPERTVHTSVDPVNMSNSSHGGSGEGQVTNGSRPITDKEDTANPVPHLEAGGDAQKESETRDNDITSSPVDIKQMVYATDLREPEENIRAVDIQTDTAEPSETKNPTEEAVD